MRRFSIGGGVTDKLEYPEQAFDTARRIGPDIFVALSGGDPESSRHALFLPPSLDRTEVSPVRLTRARSLLPRILNSQGPFVTNDLIDPQYEEESEFRKHGICSYVAIQLAGAGSEVAALMFASRAVRRFDALTIGTLLDHVDEWSRTKPPRPPEEEQADPPRAFDDEAVIGESPEFLEVCRLIAQVARIDSTVLIRGESGTGKKRLARTIHRYSARAEGTFARVDGSSLGTAFEGGGEAEGGDIAAALSGGTLLVDEIVNLSAPDQATLLRLLQKSEAQSGPDSEKEVRVVATTAADLDAAMARGQFRQDLYYRLAVIPITIPPLRGRRKDILPLAGHFLAEAALRLEKPPLVLTDGARDLLLAHEWPGNSRELSNAIEYAVLVTRGRAIRPEDLPASVRQKSGAGSAGELLSLRERLLRFEKEVITDAVRRSTGDRKEIARILGVDPRNVSYFLKKHGLR